MFLGTGLAKAEKKSQAGWRKPVRTDRAVTRWEGGTLGKQSSKCFVTENSREPGTAGDRPLVLSDLLQRWSVPWTPASSFLYQHCVQTAGLGSTDATSPHLDINPEFACRQSQRPHLSWTFGAVIRVDWPFVCLSRRPALIPRGGPQAALLAKCDSSGLDVRPKMSYLVGSSAEIVICSPESCRPWRGLGLLALSEANGHVAEKACSLLSPRAASCPTAKMVRPSLSF